MHDRQLKGLAVIAQQDDHSIQRRLVVCQEPQRRKTSGIEIVPYQEFLEDLWGRRILE